VSRRIFVVGSANMDLVLHVPRLPFPGETLTGSDLQLIPGGKGANQACAAARSGGDVHFIGCTGSDAFGPQLIGSLTDAGVNVTRVRTVAGASGCASIYVQPGGQNCIVISPGANAAVDPGYVGPALNDLTAEDLILLQLEIPFETVQFTLELAAKFGAVTILDPAPARKFSEDTLRLVRILTPNQTEAATLLGTDSFDVDGSDVELAPLASAALELGPESVIFKLGREGCAVFSSQAWLKLDGYVVQAVDTTAAGDIFNGALAAALAGNDPLSRAAEFANAAAAFSVTRPGAQTSVPARAEVEEFLREQGKPRIRNIAPLNR
jgi:ribokinase